MLLWDTEAALVSGGQPTLLICHVSTSNAGPGSSIAGTNRSQNPISGFSAVIFDDEQLQGAIVGDSTRRKAPLRLRSGLVVNTFDFDFPAASSDARVIDGGTRPTYQFNLEVDRVVFPVEKEVGEDSATRDRMVWSPESFTVAEKEKVPLVKSPGFLVDPPTEQSMLQCMREVFGLDPEQARVRPYSEAKDPRVGLRTSDHPLHDLLIGRQRESPNEFYAKLKGESGRIVAARHDSDQQLERDGLRLVRAMRVFTRPLDQLMREWRR